MYNEERKRRFLERYPNNTKVESMLNSVSPYEEKYGLDLCELPFDVLREIFRCEFGYSVDAVTSIFAYAKRYVAWCKKSGYPTSDDIELVNVDLSDKFRSSLVGSPRHLEMILDKCFKPIELKDSDILGRCYLWFAFFGISLNQICDIRVDELDFDNLVVRHNGKIYEICREAVPALRVACFSPEFSYDPGRGRAPYNRVRLGGEFVMRGIRSEKVDISVIQRSIRNAVKSGGFPSISFRTVSSSGVYYRAYESERLGFKPNFDGVIAERLAATPDLTPGERNDKAVAALRLIKKDYEVWKSVFT